MSGIGYYRQKMISTKGNKSVYKCNSLDVLYDDTICGLSESLSVTCKHTIYGVRFILHQ